MGRHIKLEQDNLSYYNKSFVTEYFNLQATYNNSNASSNMEATEHKLKTFRGLASSNQTKWYTICTENLSRIPVYLLGGRQSVATEGVESHVGYESYLTNISHRIFKDRIDHMEESNYNDVRAQQKLNKQIQSHLTKRKHLHKFNSITPVMLNPNLANKPAEELEGLFSDLLDTSLTLPTRFDKFFTKPIRKQHYEDLFRNFICKDSDGTYFQFRDFGVEANHFSIVDHVNKKVIAMVTLNPDYVDYYLLKMRAGDADFANGMNKSIFTITLDKDFDKKSSIYSKEFIKLIQKGFIDVLTDFKVERINGNSFYNELFTTGLKDLHPKLNAIESVDYNDELQRTMIESVCTEAELKEKKIRIIH